MIRMDLLILIICIILGPVLRGVFQQKTRRGPWDASRPKYPRRPVRTRPDFPDIDEVDLKQPKYLHERELKDGEVDVQILDEYSRDWKENMAPVVEKDRVAIKGPLRSTKKITRLMQKDNLLYGIIMREILAPPRAFSKKYSRF